MAWPPRRGRARRSTKRKKARAALQPAQGYKKQDGEKNKQNTLNLRGGRMRLEIRKGFRHRPEAPAVGLALGRGAGGIGREGG